MTSVTGSAFISISLPVTVYYAGPAPYEVAGVSQINFAAASGPLSLESGTGGVGAFYVYVEP